MRSAVINSLGLSLGLGLGLGLDDKSEYLRSLRSNSQN